jgi:hypothetical protein
VSVPAADKLRRVGFFPERADLLAAADLLDTIDAQVAAYMNDSIGSSAAIQAISRLLHPEGGPS